MNLNELLIAHNQEIDINKIRNLISSFSDGGYTSPEVAEEFRKRYSDIIKDTTSVLTGSINAWVFHSFESDAHVEIYLSEEEALKAWNAINKKERPPEPTHIKLNIR